MSLDAEREQVARASRRLAEEGLVLGTAGNVSARNGDREPTSEVGLHLGVYERYDAGAVVHTHAPWATAIACALDELPLVHYGMVALGGPIRVAPYHTFGTPELADAVLEAL